MAEFVRMQMPKLGPPSEESNEKTTSKPHQKERLKEKQCQFQGCSAMYYGTGFSKYCAHHRQRQFRKIISQISKSKIIREDSNQVFRHDNTYTEDKEFKCECCGISFFIIIYPGQFIYPKYCNEHRNEFKRKRYFSLNKPEIIEKPDFDSVLLSGPDLIIPSSEMIILPDTQMIDYEEEIEILGVM